MAWVKVNKPSSSSWTNSNPPGKEQYDDANVTYDSPTTYYDGANPDAWTKVNKPSSSSWTKINKPT